MRNCPPDCCKSSPGKLIGRAHEASIEIVAQVIAAGAGAVTVRFRSGGLDARLSHDHARNIPQRIPARPRVYIVEELSVEHG